MMPNFSLPEPSDRLEVFNEYEAYCRLFMDIDIWEPFVRHICSKNNLACEQVRAGLAGTYPTFIVDDRWVVKLFGRLFDGELAYAVELESARLVRQDNGIPVPDLIASGDLFSRAERWHWPYLIFQFLPGSSLGSVYGQVPLEERLRIAEEISAIARRLHQLPLTASSLFQPDWSSYQAFLASQREGCAQRHRAWARCPFT